MRNILGSGGDAIMKKRKAGARAICFAGLRREVREVFRKRG